MPVKQESDYLGLGSRLRETAAPELVESAYRFELKDAPILYRGLSLADIAHLLMLLEVGVVPREAGRPLLAALLELHDTPLDEIPLDVALGDVYNSREQLLKQRVPDVAGWLHAGRPRREASTIAYLIALRNRLLDLVAALAAYSRALTGRAGEHVDTIMPDYTYLQHAHPTTLAHYLLAFAYPVLRDFDRLLGLFRRVNTGPGGAGSINGSRLPLNRRRLAELLGFDGVTVNTRDAMWQADGPIEVSGAVVAALINVDRLAEDLQIWATREFNLIELADRHTRTSVIMPQKKNPYSLAYIRGVTANLIGKTASMAAYGQTPSGQVDNRIFAYGELPLAVDRATQAVRLMAGVLQGLSVNSELMARRAAEGYAQSTDLADVIMQETGLDFRTAHEIVGLVVRNALERGVPATKITPAMVDEAAREMIGHALELPAAVVAGALDPHALVNARVGLGGAAPQPVREMIRECRRRTDEAAHWQEGMTMKLQQVEEELVTRARTLAYAERG